MSSSPPTRDNEMTSPVPVPSSPSTAQPAHAEPQTLMTAGCKHPSDSTTPSFATDPFQSIELCPLCKLREAVSLAEHHRAQNDFPLLGSEGSLYFSAWRRARLALANYLYEAHGTDGCSEEEENPRWIETVRLEATQLDPNVLTAEEEKEEALERLLAAPRARAEGKAAALTPAAAARNRKKRKSAHVVAGGDDEVDFEGRMSTLRVNSTAGLPMPEPTENVETTHPAAQISLSTMMDPPKPLIAILKTTKITTDANITASSNLNPTSISVSLTHHTNKQHTRNVTFHPTAAVQNTPNASNDAVSQNKKGKKRQRQEDEDGGNDGNDSGDWKYEGIVLTMEEVARMGGGRQLRSRTI